MRRLYVKGSSSSRHLGLALDRVAIVLLGMEVGDRVRLDPVRRNERVEIAHLDSDDAPEPVAGNWPSSISR